VKTNYLIAIKQLKSRNDISFFTFSTLLSIIGLTLGVSSLLIISSITRGFNQTIEDKLSNIDGHLRINNIFQDEITNEESNQIISLLDTVVKNSTTYPYFESHGMIRNKSLTDGVIIYGVDKRSVENIFHLNEFETKGNCNLDDLNTIILGEKLATSLEIEINDDVILFNINNVVNKNIIKASSFKVAGFFSTGFPEYDKLPVFIDIQNAKILFETDNLTGTITSINNVQNLDEVENKINIVLPKHFQQTTWKDRHYQLISWLNIYDIPIKLLMLFITLIAIFNIASTLWMDITQKTREIGILKTIGFLKKDIYNIFIIKSFIIGFVGILAGSVLAILLIGVQYQFHIIEIPSSVYFMSYLPVATALIDFIIISVVTLFATVIFSLFPAKFASNIKPSIAVAYE